MSERSGTLGWGSQADRPLAGGAPGTGAGFPRTARRQAGLCRQEKNRDFCAVLVDYVSAWHFEVCEQLVSEAKAFDDEKALKLAEEINPRINDITQIALAFNDHCEKGECKDTERFAEKLTKLGALLHERFELEDCLIEVLHNAHKEEGAVEA